MSLPAPHPVAWRALGACARALGLCQTAPVIGEEPTPQLARLALAVLLTAVLAPLWIAPRAMAGQAVRAPLLAPGPASPGMDAWLPALPALAVDLAIGLAMGLALALPLHAMRAAMGLLGAWSGGAIADHEGEEGPQPAHSLGVVATVSAFLLCGGDRLLVRLCGASLEALPPASGPQVAALSGRFIPLCAAYLAQAALLGTRLVGPVLVAQTAAAWLLRPRPALAPILAPAYTLACLILLTWTIGSFPAVAQGWLDTAARAMLP